MSLITSAAAVASGAPPAPPAPIRTIVGNPAASEAQPSGQANEAGGGTTAGETTQAQSRIPPVIATRAANAGSDARPGGEGQDAQARPDPAIRVDAEEARARQEAEAVRRKLIQKELLARIPVPVEAIPKLTGDVEQVRSIDAQEETVRQQADQTSG